MLDVARDNPTDGTRMVAALAARELPGPGVNRKRVQRLMREHQLLQPKRSESRRKRPGYFEVTRPDELWHLDMTSIWVAEHGWCYLNAAIDGCTREITGWAIDVRCRQIEASAVIDRAVAERGIGPGQLTLGESWFSKLELRCVWREEFETLDEARAKITAYIDGYDHRPHSGLNYKTPREVAAAWKDHPDHLTHAA